MHRVNLKNYVLMIEDLDPKVIQEVAYWLVQGLSKIDIYRMKIGCN